jgi:hypothetical protein
MSETEITRLRRELGKAALVIAAVRAVLEDAGCDCQCNYRFAIDRAYLDAHLDDGGPCDGTCLPLNERCLGCRIEAAMKEIP